MVNEARKRCYKSSELVGKYYKHLRILPQDVPNGKYDTKDFSQSSKGLNIKLLNNASMGDEQIIMFNEKELQNRFKAF